MKKFLGEWKWAILGGVGILLLGFLVRFYHLTILPVFADEAIYIRWSQVMKAESTLRFLPLSDGKQPLFMWLVIPFLKIFSDPLVAGRFTSVASGMGTIIGIFALSYLLFKSKKVSLLASFVYAISPFSIFFDRIALADSLLTLFGVWTLFLGILTVKYLRLDFAMLTGFALGGAWLTKSPALFYSLLLPFAFIYSKLRSLIKVFLLFAVVYALSLGIYNILRLGPNFHLIALRNQDYVNPISHVITNWRDPFVFYIDRSFEWIRMMGPWMIIPLWIAGYFALFRKYKKEAFILTLWFLVPILVQSEFAKVFTARYILFSLPYLFILAASSFLIGPSIFRKLLWLGLAVFVVQSAQFDYYLLTNPEKANLPRSERSGYLEEWTGGQGIKETADYIREYQRKNPQTKIVVGTEGYFGTLPDGLQMYLNDKPEITVIGTGLDFRQLPDSLKESQKSGNKTYLVVNKSRFKGKIEDLGLILIGAYPKALRVEGTKEFSLLGPQEVLYFFELTDKSL